MRRLTSAGLVRLWQRLPAGVASSASIPTGRPVRGGWIAEVEETERQSHGDPRHGRQPGARPQTV